MHRSRRLVVWAVSLTALASMGSCTTVMRYAVEGAVEAVTGEDVDLDETGERGSNTGQWLDGARAGGAQAPAAVYEAGPTPGWELGFRLRPSVGSAYYQNRVCVNLPLRIDFGRLWSRQASDPFGSLERVVPPLLEQENNQGIDPGYTRFGEVRMGGPSPATMIWRSAGLLRPYGSSGVRCPLLGIFSLGQTGESALILR